MKQKEINVLYVLTKLELGGAQKVCLSLLDGLHKAGAHAHLISGADGYLAKNVKAQPHVTLLTSFKREVSLFSLLGEITTFIALIKEIKKCKRTNPHLIVHTHSTKAGILGRWAALFAGVKKRVHTVHGYGFHGHQNKIAWLVHVMLEFITSLITTHYVCVSSEDVKTGIKFFPRFVKKHSIIRAAVEWEKFYIPAHTTTLREDTAKPFTFGTIACFKKQKNLPDLFKAFELAHQHNSNMRLEVIGDGHLRPELETWITHHKLQDKISLLGWQDDVTPHMLTWDAFTLSSLWEGLPCAVVEARLLKLPIICYKTGGIHDVVINGENGYLIKPGDWKALSMSMLEISKNQQLLLKLTAHEEDLTDFNDQKMIQEHIDLYLTL